jgi:predicted transcriptional regulator YheO
MSRKYPKSDLPESIRKPHAAALRNNAKNSATGRNDVAKDETEEHVILRSESKRKRAQPTSTPTPRRKPIEMPSQGLKQSDILTFNTNAEKAFVRLISEILREDGQLPYRAAIREAAYELNVSTETAKRYLEKHCARRAEFSIEDGSVTLRKVKS